MHLSNTHECNSLTQDDLTYVTIANKYFISYYLNITFLTIKISNDTKKTFKYLCIKDQF